MFGGRGLTLRVQVPNNHVLTQNLYYNSYYPNPKYLIIGYMDPLGNGLMVPELSNLRVLGVSGGGSTPDRSTLP